jgi:8-oxoguanine deaminase
VAALVFCAPQQVDWNIVHGRVVVRAGQLQTLDVPALVERHNRAARRLLAGA